MSEATTPSGRASRPTPGSAPSGVPLCDIALYDAKGTKIRLLCRVEQADVDKSGGAYPIRLHEQGDVVGRDATQVYVRFDNGNQCPIPLLPRLVRVLDPPAGTEDVNPTG